MTTTTTTTTADRVNAAAVIDCNAPTFNYDGVIVVTPATFIYWVWQNLDVIHFYEVDHPEAPAHIEERIKHNAVLDALAKLSPDLYADAVRSWKPM